MRLAALLLALIAGCHSALADDIVVPASVLERNQPVGITYRMTNPATGKGVLGIEWTDAYGRTVERRRLVFAADHASRLDFRLDMRRAVAMRNELRTHLTFEGVSEAGVRDRREVDSAASFTAAPPARPWSDYQIIMWQGQTPEQLAALKRLGITAGMVLADRDNPGSGVAAAKIEPLLRQDLRWYVENIATDFYSAYHRWTPDRPVNALFLAAQKRYLDNPLDVAAFVRTPSLSDPEWLTKIQDRLSATVRAHSLYRPLYYNLGDETGIADLSAFWDFDLSPSSLQGMRQWLRQRYGTLAALNEQWGSNYTRWDAVVPMTTRDAIARPDENYSAWADFKEWMDVAFARSLRLGTEAVHAADPGALAGIEGAQIPGWGGYDYSRLAKAVDVIEMDDASGSFEVARLVNPGLVILRTSFRSGPEETHREWRALLRGSRGLILWDPKAEFVSADGALGPRGRDAARTFAELRDGLGALLINSTRRTDPVAILYSPASMRTQWLLDMKPQGEAWSRRNAEMELADNAVRSATRHYAQIIEHMGLQPQFVPSRLIEQGELHRHHYRILVLPHAVALSAAEADEIRHFVRDGGVVIADSVPGAFDQHSRKQAKPLLSDVFGNASVSPASFDYGDGKAIYLGPADGSEDKVIRKMDRIFTEAAVGAIVTVTSPSGEPVRDVSVNLFQNGELSIVALQRDLPTGEGAANNSPPQNSEAVALSLPHPSFVYDVRKKRELGRTNRVNLTLDPYQPVLLAIANSRLPEPTIAAPQRLHAGETAELSLGLAAASPAALHVFHVDVLDPAGRIVGHYSGNVLAPRGTAQRVLPLAFNDPAGTWTIRMTDIASGQTTIKEMKVVER